MQFPFFHFTQAKIDPIHSQLAVATDHHLEVQNSSQQIVTLMHRNFTVNFPTLSLKVTLMLFALTV